MLSAEKSPKDMPRRIIPMSMRAQRTLSADNLDLASTVIDNTIDLLHETFPPQADSRQFERDARRLRHALDSNSQFLENAVGTPDNYTAYYSLLAREALALEMIIMPTLLATPGTADLIADARRGAAAKTATVLDSALTNYDRLNSRNKRAELAGAIGELTFYLLPNHDERPDFTAVPSSLRDDFQRRTDAFVYHRWQNGATLHRAPVQVKVSPSKAVAAHKGFAINGRDMSNIQADGFPVSRALVAAHKASHLTPQESATIQQASDKLYNTLHHKTYKTPGVQIAP